MGCNKLLITTIVTAQSQEKTIMYLHVKCECVKKVSTHK